MHSTRCNRRFFRGRPLFPRGTLCAQLTNNLAGALPDPSDTHDRLVHEFKNHMSVVVGFCDLLLSELPADDPRRNDLEQMHVASHAAVALLPRLLRR